MRRAVSKYGDGVVTRVIRGRGFAPPMGTGVFSKAGVSGETMAVRVRRGASVTVPLPKQLGKARRLPPRPS